MATFLTIDEVASILGVSTKTVRRRLADGSLHKAPLGGRAVRISASEIDRLLLGEPVSGPPELAPGEGNKNSALDQSIESIPQSITNVCRGMSS